MGKAVILLRRSGASFVSNELIRLAVLTTIVALELDWATKTWALDTLHGTLPFGAVLLRIEHNAAFAFSTGAGLVSRDLVVGVRLGALAALVLLSAALGLRERRHAAGMGLVLGGGLGNTADLLLRSHGVVDFIDTGPFAFQLHGREVVFGLVFNTADVAVLIGVVLLAPVIGMWAVAMRQRIRQLNRSWLADES